MAIPGLGTLYAIYKRDIDRDNAILSKRIELSDELRKNAKSWTVYLETAFDEAIKLYRKGLKDDALGRIDEQISDFMNLDYDSLKEEGPILSYLAEDDRFSSFVKSCIDFYSSALDIKRLVYSGIENADGENKNMVEHDIGLVVSLYRSETECMYRGLIRSYNELKIIEPK